MMKTTSIIMRATTIFPSKLAALAAAILVTGAFALLVGSFSGQAVAASAGNSNNAFAVGGFIAATFPNPSQVAFAAQINPQKFPPSYAGHVVQTDAAGVSRHGPVDCVTVSPPMAVVVWHVTKSDDPNQVANEPRSFEVIDGGEPPTGMDMYTDRGTANPNNCTSDTNLTFVPVVRGNIVVKGP